MKPLHSKLGNYRDGALIVDQVCAREDLKRLIFEHRQQLVGCRVVLVASHLGKSWAMQWGFMRDGAVIANINCFFGRYRLDFPPTSPTEVLDRDVLRTARRFLLGCSICGEHDIYCVGMLRLCSKHKTVGVARRAFIARTVFEPTQSEKVANHREADKRLKSKDRLQRWHSTMRRRRHG